MAEIIAKLIVDIIHRQEYVENEMRIGRHIFHDSRNFKSSFFVCFNQLSYNISAAKIFFGTGF